MPFREESCRSSCIYSGPLHSYSRDAVSQYLSTRAGAESIQLIYSGCALQALSDLARQFRCHPIFLREFQKHTHTPMHIHATLQNNIYESKVHRGSALGLGASGLPYYCAQLVCVPDVMGMQTTNKQTNMLAVWRYTSDKPKTKNQSRYISV